MMSLSRYFGINCIIMCCIFWIVWLTEAKIISKVGDKITLNCSNDSLNMLSLLAWRMNGQNLLISRRPIQENKTHMYENATKLNLKMLTSESQLYGLVIENAQKSHEGNYTCETTTAAGVFEKNWELLITDAEDWHDSSSTEEAENSLKPLIVAVVAVSCACSLILISLFVLGCVWKRRAGNVNRPSATIRQQPREEIYENHLEIKRQVERQHKAHH